MFVPAGGVIEITGKVESDTYLYDVWPQNCGSLQVQQILHLRPCAPQTLTVAGAPGDPSCAGATRAGSPRAPPRRTAAAPRFAVERRLRPAARCNQVPPLPVLSLAGSTLLDERGDPMLISSEAPRCVGPLPCVLAIMLLVPAMVSAGNVTLIDGVLHVMNPARPPRGVQTVELEELWRAGGEDDDVFYGLIGKVCCDEQGNIFVLDSQVCQVYVYSPRPRIRAGAMQSPHLTSPTDTSPSRRSSSSLPPPPDLRFP
ncbi:MAG TPA: hypothetical protein PLL30_00410 [Candidatus Krumholzibacteria bacterium]|nr:hypothetical protein [Candidatus Krumholzibacteria bacterium]HPD70221.1 hypothetical protein [Candidatus Krumholzibacteria bacterium]HRY40079.1 hypothetical protein [Candidatus Krumholzibacteria bacterium]